MIGLDVDINILLVVLFVSFNRAFHFGLMSADSPWGVRYNECKELASPSVPGTTPNMIADYFYTWAAVM